MKPMDKKLREVSERHERKYTSLLKEHNILFGLKQNPNDIITNLTGDIISSEQESILRFGLKHGLPLDLKNQTLSLLQNLYGTN